MGTPVALVDGLTSMGVAQFCTPSQGYLFPTEMLLTFGGGGVNIIVKKYYFEVFFICIILPCNSRVKQE